MKNASFALGLLAALTFAGSTNASVVLLDELSLNGDFDSSTNDWVEQAGRNSRYESVASLAGRPTGASNLFIAIDHRREASLDLGYTIKAGDTFDLSYYFTADDSLTGQWDFASDNGSVFLLASSSMVADPSLATEAIELNSGLDTTGYATFEQVSAAGLSFSNPDSIGKGLFLFIQKQTSDETDELFGVDNISVTVTQFVPEPSSAALAGLSSILLLRRRRR